MTPLDLMFKSQDELNDYLKKTVTLSDIAPGGALSREQAMTYIDLLVDQTEALKPGGGITQIKTTQTSGEVPMYDICEPTVTGATEFTSETSTECDMDARKPTFGKFLYDLVDLKQEYAITHETLRGNVAKNRLKTLINNLMAKSSGNDLEYLFWQGDTATWAADVTATGKLLKTLNGIIVQALDCTSPDLCSGAGAVLTGTGINVTYDHFAALLRRLPRRYSQNLGILEWWVNPTLAADYRYWLGSTGDSEIANMDKDRDRPIAPLGIPMREVPWMPYDATGNDNYILLTTKGNMWYAINTGDYKRYSRFSQHCRAFFYTNYFSLDCGIRDCAQMVIMNGIAVRASASFTI